MTEFWVLIVLGAAVGAVWFLVRTLLLPSEIRQLRSRVENLERDALQLGSRLKDAVVTIDALRREGVVAPARDTARDPSVTDASRAASEAATTAEQTEPFAPEPIRAMPPPLPMTRMTGTTQRPASPTRAAQMSAGFERTGRVTEQGAAPRPVLVEDFEPLGAKVGRWFKRLGPNDPKMGWEMALGTYWLPRLGAIALSTAIVFVLTLAFQRWGEHARVAMGYGVAGVLLGLGWKLDTKYPKYARVLFGAGFALTYFVTYATYFVPLAKIFEAPYLTLAALAAIVIVWAGLAQRRRSVIIAGVAVLVGHFTIALATNSIANPGVYSVAGIVFLSMGGAYFLARNGWYAVAALGMLASYANHFYLITKIDSTGTTREFAVGIAILSTYFLVYALAELFAPDGVRRVIPLWARNAFVTANSLCVLILGTLLMSGYDFAKDEQHLFEYALGAVLLAISLAYLHGRARDPLYNTYFAKGISVLTLALAVQYDADTLTMSLALESAILIFAARRSGLVVTRVLALGAGALAVGQGAWTLLTAEHVAYGDPDFLARAAEAGVVVLSLLATALLYHRTDWSVRSPTRTRFSDDANALLWRLDFIRESPDGTLSKPFGGLIIPSLFSLCAALLGVGYAKLLMAPEHFTLSLAISAAALSLAAAPLRATYYGLAGLIFFGTTAIFASMQFAWASNDNFVKMWGFRAGTPVESILTLVLTGAVAIASERNYFGRFAGLRLHQAGSLPYALYGVVAWLVGLYLNHANIANEYVPAALITAALGFGLYAVGLNRTAMAWCAAGLLAWGVIRWNQEWRADASTGFLIQAWAAIALAALGERFFARLGVRVVGSALMCIAAAAFVPYVGREVPRVWVVVGWTAGAAAFAVFGVMTRERAATVLGVTMLAAASLYQCVHARESTMPVTPLVLGFAAPALCWIALERALTRRKAAAGMPEVLRNAGAVAAGVASLLLVLMLFHLPHAQKYYLTISWSVLALALFGVAIAFGEKVYRYFGLAVLALASVRVIAVDTRELDTLPKVFAWGGLGIVLLALGYGYVRVFARSKVVGAEETKGT